MRMAGLVLVGAMALGGLAGCGKKPAVEPPLPSVRVAEIRRGAVPLYVETFGNGASVASVVVVPQVTGILAETKFAEGASVKVGDPLFQIDPKPYQAALDQAKGNLETAQADLLNAQQNLERKQKLYETKVIDIQELQNEQANVTGAEGDVISAQAAVQTAEINLGYTTIASPINGKTGQYLINTGNLVTANSSELVSIRTLDPIYVDYTLAETDLPRVQRYLGKGELAVEVRIPGDAEFLAKGTLTFTDNEIAPQTGTLSLRATVPNPDGRLLPGQFVTVRLILEEIPDALLVPATAVLVGADGDFVFLLKADNTVEQRAVTRGQREGTDFVITAGLVAGEKVVTSGQVAIAPGAKVVVVAPATAASPPPTPAATPESAAK